MESIKDQNSFPIEKTRPCYMGFLLFAGVLLPAGAFGIELLTRMCAERIFDPMPTWWHTLFVFFVAATNFQTWRAIRQNRGERAVWLGFANAVAVFIALFYAILFAPVLPLAIVGLILFLLGLLPMAPLFSLVAALLMRRDLRRMSPDKIPSALRWQGLLSGFLIVFVAVGLAEMTFALTKNGINLASSEAPEQQAEGLNFIRRYGDENYLLRLCYNRSGVVTTDYLFNALQSGGVFRRDETANRSLTEKARETFYRLNGADYRTIQPPRGIREWERGEFNSQMGETGSAIVSEGLSLADSQINGSIDGDAAVGYLEWTLRLKNEKSWQQEAVAQIQLPPGAVVSRLTLWINGEEREAAFAGKAQVTAAYNAVVSKRKDPVLVTVSGKDRVSMRAFPVPPSGGEMKIRIGITAPLELESEQASRLPMPYFQERNFAASIEHSIWFESKKPLEIADPNFTQETLAGFFAVRGRVKNEDLMKIGSPVRAVKSNAVETAWSRDKTDAQNVVRPQIQESVGAKPERIVFVVDASAGMKDFQREIAETIGNFPFEQETALILTGGNGLNRELAAPNAFDGNPSAIAEKIENADFSGGTDAVAALEKAWELTQAKPNGAVVWIHAPQTIALASSENLIQMWTRRPNSPAVYSLSSKIGADVVEKKLGEFNVVEFIPRFSNLGDDLNSHLSRINRQKRAFESIRTKEDAKNFKPPANAKETSAHLIRLWANDEVKRLLAEKLRVCERIYDDAGNEWTDVSAWYWSALNESEADWWAITVAETEAE